jgi:hypothetical protein
MQMNSIRYGFFLPFFNDLCEWKKYPVFKGYKSAGARHTFATVNNGDTHLFLDCE